MELVFKAKLTGIKDPQQHLLACDNAFSDASLPLAHRFWAAHLAAIACLNLLMYNEAEQWTSTCTGISVTLGSDKYLAVALITQGTYHFVQRDYVMAMTKLDDAARVLKRTPNTHNELVLQEIRTRVFWHDKRYDEAIKEGFIGLRLARLAGDKQEEGQFLNFLAVLFRIIGSLKESISYQHLAASVSHDLGNRINEAISYYELGGCYYDLAEYDKAREFFERALEIFDDTKDNGQRALILSGLAKVNQMLGRLVEAEEAAREALDLVAMGEDELVISQKQVTLAAILVAARRFGEALTYLMKADEFQGARIEKDEIELARYLAEAFVGIGNHQRAFEFKEKQRVIEQAYAKLISAGQLQYQEILQKESAEKTAEILRLKERDLANTASSLAAQTELLGNFRADLRKIVLRPDRYEPEDIIRQVKAKLKELPCEMIDFSKFEGQFATVHPEFRAKLETKYPDLTPQEVKMCMLIHVNLKTPAIARLMCISDRTVEFHRVNVRAKMKLGRGEDLAEYLRTI